MVSLPLFRSTMTVRLRTALWSLECTTAKSPLVSLYEGLRSTKNQQVVSHWVEGSGDSSGCGYRTAVRFVIIGKSVYSEEAQKKNIDITVW